MTMRNTVVKLGVEAGKAGVTGLLCVMMVTLPAAASASGPAVGTPTTAKPTPPRRYSPLTSDQKVLHALNRMTFGPRPGDEAAISKMGLDKWFEAQLHPETIDDSKFEARLDALPVLKLDPLAMMTNYPSPLFMRGQADRKVLTPSDPVEHAIYTDWMAGYFDRMKKGSDEPAGKKAKGDGMGDMAVAQPPAPAKSTISDAELKKMSEAEWVDPKVLLTKEQIAAIAAKRPLLPPMDQDDIKAVLALEPQARFDRLVAMSPLEMVSFHKGLKGEQNETVTEGMTPYQTAAVNSMGEAPLQTVRSETAASRILRDIYSERQVQAVMDDFWLNHFSVYFDKSEREAYYLPSYEKDVVLPNALGKFEDLLVATAKSPAMLMYLDNWESVGPHSVLGMKPRPKGAEAKGINENYGRELLELHTYGVRCEVSAEHPASKLDPSCAGGYTQQDVIEVSKCFTGWTIDKPVGGGTAVATYDPSWHEPGPKMVLGHKIEEGGQKEAMEVLHILSTSSATATFVSMKMASRFVSDTPPPALVARMTATFLKSDGDIKSVLLTMFHSPEFWAPNNYRAKLKTPIEFVASAVRAGGIQVKNPTALVQAVKQLGMPIYGKETPDGYSWKPDAWVSSNALVTRMNFALTLSNGTLPGTHTKWHSLLNVSDDSPIITSPDKATEASLESIILGQPATPKTRESVMQEFNNPAVQQAAEKKFVKKAQPDDAVVIAAAAGKPPADPAVRPLNTMAGLLLGSPDFQRR